MQPGKETFHLPAPLGAPQRAAIISMPKSCRSCWSRASESYPRSPIRRGGRSSTKRASSVAGTRCGSYGEALATCTARGRPWPSQIAMILLPLPRRVGPTAAPLFSPRRRSHRRRLPSGPVCRGRADRPRAVQVVGRVDRSVARVESADDTSDTADSVEANRATGPPSATPRAPR